MKQPGIQTYGVNSFLNKHSLRSNEAYVLKEQAEQFFVVKVEQMFQTMRLPVPPTRATIHTILFLTAGSATMHIGSDVYRINKNECLVVPAGQVFSFSNPDVNKGYQCSFHNDFLLALPGGQNLLKTFGFLQAWNHPVITPGRQAGSFITTLLKRLLTEYTANGLLNRHLLQSYLLALLAELNQAYNPLPGRWAGQPGELASRFRQLLYEHIRSVHRVADYAAMLNISPSHLNKTVRTVTGKPPIKWINETLVLEAKVLLHQTRYPVNEVAAQLGLLDQSYFSRLFKKHAGLSPEAFRRMMEKC